MKTEKEIHDRIIIIEKRLKILEDNLAQGTVSVKNIFDKWPYLYFLKKEQAVCNAAIRELQWLLE
jgi:hypothetical protein